jgi:transposase-like protein
MGRKRRSPEEKAQIALEALREDKPVREIAEKYGVHPNQIWQRKRSVLDSAGDVFRGGAGSRETELESGREELLKQLGQAQVEKAFLQPLISSSV